MKKVLSIFMAIMMVVTMFSFSTVAFAEGEAAEKSAKSVFIGTSTQANFGLKYDRRQGVLPDTTQGTLAKPWNLHIFNPETAITIPAIANVQPTVGNSIIDIVNGYASSGDYSEVIVRSTGGATGETVKFVGLKGTADTPIVITSERYDAEIPMLVKFENNATATPAILLEDCEYVVVKAIEVSAGNNGIVVDGCSNVKIEKVSFSKVGFVDYITPVVDEAGNESINAMDTTSILDKGSSILVGANCENVTVSACSFAKCRAGVVADSTGLEEGETESTGIQVLDCTFEEITDVAVMVNASDNVVVSGGSVTKSGTLANAADYDGTVAADFMVVDAANVTIEKVYSTDNNSFIYAENSTGRVRYNVSDRDGYSYVDAADLLIYNNTFAAATSLDLTAKVRNNIFSMLIGEKVAVSDGDNNCYYWTSKGDKGSIRKNPRFANAFDGSVEGTSVKDNYILATGSPCIGKGEKVEDDMGTTDFYGNTIGESINIGAYAGEGAEATVEIASDFVDFFAYIIALIKNFFGIA